MMRRYSSCLITGALALIGLVALPVLEAAAETAVVYGASGRVGGVIVAEALARGVDLSAAVERAVHAGAVTATRPGAQPAMPTTADIEASMSGRAGTL